MSIRQELTFQPELLRVADIHASDVLVVDGSHIATYEQHLGLPRVWLTGFSVGQAACSGCGLESTSSNSTGVRRPSAR